LKQEVKNKKIEIPMAKILIVDDEESIRFTFSLILTDAGHEVFKAESRSEAMAILDSTKIDVAVVDRFLGSHNGMDIIQYVHMAYGSCTPLLMSSYPLPASLKLNPPFFAFVQKPVKKNALCKAIEGAIASKNLNRC
jgi:DNA-binding NtrC family response regulator